MVFGQLEQERVQSLRGRDELPDDAAGNGLVLQRQTKGFSQGEGRFGAPAKEEEARTHSEHDVGCDGSEGLDGRLRVTQSHLVGSKEGRASRFSFG